jgi:ATP synthase protein I
VYFLLTSLPVHVKSAAEMDKIDRKSLIQMGYASSIGIAMVLAIFGSLFFGSWLDKTILFLVIGVVAGFKNIYNLIQRNFKDEEPVIKSLKSEPHRKRPTPAKA